MIYFSKFSSYWCKISLHPSIKSILSLLHQDGEKNKQSTQGKKNKKYRGLKKQKKNCTFRPQQINFVREVTIK